MVTGRVEVDGVVRELAWEDVRLQPDDAGDLARQPRASVELVERRVTVDGLVLPVWRVTALGFVEHEAWAAHDSGMAELGSILSSDGWR